MPEENEYQQSKKEYILTDSDVATFRTDMMSWFELNVIPSKRYSNTIESTLNELRGVKGSTREKAFERARRIIEDVEQAILKSERTRPPPNPTIRGTTSVSDIKREFSKVDILEAGDRDEPKFSVGETVEIMTSPDSLTPDPYDGITGRITALKLLVPLPQRSSMFASPIFRELRVPELLSSSLSF
jgi:hypothetical protein